MAGLPRRIAQLEARTYSPAGVHARQAEAEGQHGPGHEGQRCGACRTSRGGAQPRRQVQFVHSNSRTTLARLLAPPQTDAARKEFLKGGASAPASGQAAAAPAPTSGLKSAAVFELIGEGVKRQGEALVSQVKGVIVFDVSGHPFTIDLKHGSGDVYAGMPKQGKPALTITVSDADMVSLADGKLNAQQAFMRGKLKLKGNMALAMKLGKVIEAAKPAAKL